MSAQLAENINYVPGEDRAEQDLDETMQKFGIQKMSKTMDDYLEYLEKNLTHGADQRGSGLIDLDNKINGGFLPGQLIVVAGRPAMGKSAFAQGIIDHISETKPVLLFSLEMSFFEIMDRFICKMSGIKMEKLKSKKGLNQDDYAKLVQVLPTIREKPIFACDRSAITIQEVVKIVDIMSAAMPLGMVAIDYLQLLSTKLKKPNREAEISEITRLLKIMARDKNIPGRALK